MRAVGPAAIVGGREEEHRSALDEHAVGIGELLARESLDQSIGKRAATLRRNIARRNGTGW